MPLEHDAAAGIMLRSPALVRRGRRSLGETL